MSHYTHAAFISYSSRYRDWVAALHKNLEATFPLHGEARPVFLDQLELVPGRGWITRLAAGVDMAAKLVLVMTPEALASPRVGDEWQGLVSSRRNWNQGQLLPVLLVTTPLPLFIGPIQYIDFREHDDERYRAALRELVGGFFGWTLRQCRELALPADLEVPPAPEPAVPVARHQELIAQLVPEIADSTRRAVLAAALGREIADPRDYGGVELAASALIVETGEDELVAALA